MARRSQFVDWVVEQLMPLGDPRARAMFGGWGIYVGDLFMGVVAHDMLYLKVDATTRDRFAAAGGEIFSYPMADGKMMEMAYYSLPAEALDDPDALRDWAREAIGAALRARAAKPRKPKRPAE